MLLAQARLEEVLQFGGTAVTSLDVRSVCMASHSHVKTENSKRPSSDFCRSIAWLATQNPKLALAQPPNLQKLKPNLRHDGRSSLTYQNLLFRRIPTTSRSGLILRACNSSRFWKFKLLPQGSEGPTSWAFGFVDKYVREYMVTTRYLDLESYCRPSNRICIEDFGV